MAILILQVMGRRFTTTVKRLTAFLYLTVCGLSVAMLLLFPSAKVHNFGTHFRTPEVRRTTQSHSFVTQSDETTAHERLDDSTPLPEFFTPVDAVQNPLASDGREVTGEVPLVRLLHRMKLDSSGSGAQAPLLQA